MTKTQIAQHPHGSQDILHVGVDLAGAPAVVILTHGRGGTAENILSLADELDREDLAYLAPQAAGSTWYPYTFMAPLEQNEPGLSSGLARLGELVERVEQDGVPASRIVLVGFSQGSCLSLEFAARHAQRYGGVVAYSGGLLGPPGTPREYPGSMDGTPVFLGCSDRDPHIPLHRVQESSEVFRRLGAQVTERIYPAMGHTINEDEIRFLRDLLAGIAPQK